MSVLPPAPDVVVLGEILVELSSTTGLVDGAQLRLGFSGDALNVAAASAASGARTAILTRVADDELGDAIEERVASLGVSTQLVRRVPGQQGSYFVRADPDGRREFVYVRSGSAASGLEPQDVADARVEEAHVVVGSGITGAISASAQAALEEAARRARFFVYDPNFRARLTSTEAAAALLRRIAPYAGLVTPADPSETRALVGAPDPVAACAALRGMGAGAVAVARGRDGVLLDDGGRTYDVPAVPPESVVDQTGAGDSLVGTTAGRLALGDGLLTAIRLGTAAASLSLAGRGGTGHVPSLSQTRTHLGNHADADAHADARWD